MASKMALVAIAVAAVCITAGAAAFLLLEQDRTYGIEYDLNGGIFASDYPTEYRSGDILDIPMPLQDDFVFTGFYTDPAMTEYFDQDTSGMKGDLKLYARWVESPVGHFIQFDTVGDCDRGLSSYTLDGGVTRMYYYLSSMDGTFYTFLIGTDSYTYTDIGQSYFDITFDTKRTPGFQGWIYKGMETIGTVEGDVECEKYIYNYENGAVGTRWISGFVTYKECYDFIGGEDSDVKSEHRTYTMVSRGDIEIPTDCSLSVTAGEGIQVLGNQGTYKAGDIVTLTAVVEEGKTFGGWYSNATELLCADETYTFDMPSAVMNIKALNGPDDWKEFTVNKQVDLDEVYGVSGGYYSLLNLETENAYFADSEFEFTEAGLYQIQSTDKDGDMKVFMAKVNGDIQRTYTWKWGGDEYSISMGFEYNAIDYARAYYDINERRQDRPDHERDMTFVELSYQDPIMAPYMEKIVDLLIDAYKEQNSRVEVRDYLNYLLAFTQYIEYQSDQEYLGYSEYWKFPIETLYDNGGDCEDTVILYVAIAHESMKRLGFN